MVGASTQREQLLLNRPPEPVKIYVFGMNSMISRRRFSLACVVLWGCGPTEFPTREELCRLRGSAYFFLPLSGDFPSVAGDLARGAQSAARTLNNQSCQLDVWIGDVPDGVPIQADIDKIRLSGSPVAVISPFPGGSAWPLARDNPEIFFLSLVEDNARYLPDRPQNLAFLPLDEIESRVARSGSVNAHFVQGELAVDVTLIVLAAAGNNFRFLERGFGIGRVRGEEAFYFYKVQDREFQFSSF